jgi:hypothetical protein
MLEEYMKKAARSEEIHQRVLAGETVTDDELIEMLYHSDFHHVKEHMPEAFEQFKKSQLPLIAAAEDFSFNGKNCESDCDWDGVARRCNCGNRRVSWCFQETSDGGYWYGEAY